MPRCNAGTKKTRTGDKSSESPGDGARGQDDSSAPGPRGEQSRVTTGQRSQERAPQENGTDGNPDAPEYLQRFATWNGSEVKLVINTYKTKQMQKAIQSLVPEKRKSYGRKKSKHGLLHGSIIVYS